VATTSHTCDAWHRQRDAISAMLSNVETPMSSLSSADHTGGRCDCHAQRSLLIATAKCPLWVKSRHVQRKTLCPLYPRKRTYAVQTGTSAISGHEPDYSITSSAAIKREGGTVNPSALAVLTLTRSSNFVACTTGRSAGFSPLSIRPV